MADSILAPFDARLRSRTGKWSLQKGLSDPAIVKRALQAVNDALTCSIARELKIGEKAIVTPEQIQEMEKTLGTKVVQVGDKLVWNEWNSRVAMVAASEVLARQYPILNRADKSSQSDYVVQIEDPNTGKKVTFKPRSRATKEELKDAIEADFEVDPDARPL